MDSAREYLAGLWDRILNIRDDETRTVLNELYRTCCDLLDRVEFLESMSELEIEVTLDDEFDS